MSAQQMNVLGAGMIGGFCLISGLGLAAYRAGSSSGRKFKKQAAVEARKNHSLGIKEAQAKEQARAKKLEAEAKRLSLEAKDLTDRVKVIERKHPVLARDTGPYELELLNDASVPLDEVVRRTVEQRLAAAGQGRKVEIAKLKSGFEVTVELDTPLTQAMVGEIRKAAADLIKHTPKVWIQNLRITRPSRDYTISLGPLAKLSPVAIGDAVEAFLSGLGVNIAAVKPGKTAKATLQWTGGRYPGTVNWFGPQEDHASATGSASATKTSVVPVPPGTYFVTANLGGVVFFQSLKVAPKGIYRFTLNSFKFPRGRRPRVGVVVPPRRTPTRYPTGYRSRRVTPPNRYRSRYTPKPRYTPKRRYTPPPRYRSRTNTRRRYR